MVSVTYIANARCSHQTPRFFEKYSKRCFTYARFIKVSFQIKSSSNPPYYSVHFENINIRKFFLDLILLRFSQITTYVTGSKGGQTDWGSQINPRGIGHIFLLNLKDAKQQLSIFYSLLGQVERKLSLEFFASWRVVRGLASGTIPHFGRNVEIGKPDKNLHVPRDDWAVFKISHNLCLVVLMHQQPCMGIILLSLLICSDLVCWHKNKTTDDKQFVFGIMSSLTVLFAKCFWPEQNWNC